MTATSRDAKAVYILQGPWFPQSCHRGSLFGCGGGRREEEGAAFHHHQGPRLPTGLTG